MQTEHNWLEHDAMETIYKDEFDNKEQISWAAYHALSYKVEATCTSITQLMSLSYDYAAFAAMVKH